MREKRLKSGKPIILTIAALPDGSLKAVEKRQDVEYPGYEKEETYFFKEIPLRELPWH